MNPQIKCMAIEHKDKIIAAISISYLLYYSNEKFREANKKNYKKKKNKIKKELSFSFPNLDAIY